MKDKAALQYDEGQMVVEVVGREPASAGLSRLDSLVKQGKNILMEGNEPRALISAGIRDALDVSLKNQFDYLKILYPKRKKILKPGLSRIFNTLAIMPCGIMYRDENQVIIPLESARELMDRPSGMSHLEVYVSKPEDLGSIQEKLQSILGEDFAVKNEMEQHADLFRILKIEKLFVFMALGFIILISSFNLFVSCSMLVINKKQDFFILSSLGMMPSMLSRLVHWLGGLISGLGLILGLALGWLVCLAQLWFGFVPLGMQSTQIQAYPIDIQGLDFILTALWVMVVSVFALWVPSAKARKVTFKSQA
jgi:lipoprotein-releasing system permease protein